VNDSRVKGLDVLLSLALANLSFSEAWKKILYDPPLLMPFWTWRDITALGVNICILAAIFFGLMTWSRNSKSRRFQLHGLLYLIPIMVALNLYRSSHENQITQVLGSLRAMVFAFGAILALALAVIIRFRRTVIPALEVLTFSTLLLIPMNFSRAMLVLARQEPLPKMATWLPAKPTDSPRVVWIIFDETDWRLAFPDRLPGVSLSNYDRLRREVLFADNAFEAGTDTQVAIPSLISGQPISRTEPVGKHTLLFWTPGSHAPKDWATEDNVFSGAHRLDSNVGVVGWYLPYCRIFASSLSACYWESMTTRVNSRIPGVTASFFSQWRSLTPLESRLRQRGRYESMLDSAKDLVSNPRLGLVLLHMSVPHGPGIYDRKRQVLTVLDFKNDWYYDNLELADRTLGDIRKAMEDSGQWDRSTVIVSSDHSLRPGIMVHPRYDPHVPFLIKAAHQKQGFDYHRAFNAVITADMILAVLSGKLQTPEEISSWLDQRSTTTGSAKSPLPVANKYSD
jgi:hypothetical protein